MKILILGGTGAMGEPLVQLLSNSDNVVFVTSRAYHENDRNINYIQGNAKDIYFLEKILNEKFDIIIDFMIYSTLEFKERVEKLLNSSKQYIFISSSRCYANSEQEIEENTKRLLDAISDENYLATDDYALAKAREENILRQSKLQNWTIIRPYITYNSQRLQLGCYEKEYWLYRILHNKTIVLPEDILNRVTTITYGDDVANCIIQLIGSERALGECFTIVTREPHTWKEILEYYRDAVFLKTGKKLKSITIPNSKEMYGVCDKYQIQYDRVYNRKFNINKLDNTIGKYNFFNTKDGIKKCIDEFIENPKWGCISAKYEAWSDRYTHEFSSLSEFKGIKEKLRYIKWRFIKKP